MLKLHSMLKRDFYSKEHKNTFAAECLQMSQKSFLSVLQAYLITCLPFSHSVPATSKDVPHFQHSR